MSKRDKIMTVLGGLLGTHNHPVTAEDTGIDHAVTPNPKGKAAGFTVPAHGTLLILKGQNGYTCRYHTHHRDLTGTGTGDDGSLATLGTGGHEQSLLLQLLDVVADGSRRPQTHCRTDFPDGGCVTILLYELVYIIQYQFGFITGSGHTDPPNGIYGIIIAHMSTK